VPVFQIDNCERIPPPEILCAISFLVLAATSLNVRGDSRIERPVRTEDNIDLPGSRDGFHGETDSGDRAKVKRRRVY